MPGYFQSPYRAEDWNTRIKFLVVVYALVKLNVFIVSKKVLRFSSWEFTKTGQVGYNRSLFGAAVVQ